MEVLKNSFSNKALITSNRNPKNQNSFQNTKQGFKTKKIKTPRLLSNIQNKVKDIPILSQKNHKSNIPSKNKPMDISTKELLTKNLLIRAFSYKKIEKNDSKSNGKNSNKVIINKKLKKNNLLEYQAHTQKIIEDINKELNYNHNKNLSNNVSNIIKEKNLSKGKNNDNNIHSIISLLNSRNKIFKRNPNQIQNLKNMSVFNKNGYNSNYNIKNIIKNNCSSLMTSNNSNLKNNYFKNESKINKLNISNNINNVININTNSKSNINSTNNTITNYYNRNNCGTKQNKNTGGINSNNINFCKNSDAFKNCKSQMYKKLNAKVINDIDNINSSYNKNFYINTSSSNVKNYIDKMKSSLKIMEDNCIKNTILDNKSNCQFLKRNKTDRGINQKEVSTNDKMNNILSNINVQEINSIYSKKPITECNNSNNNKAVLEGYNHINYNYNINNKGKNSIKKDSKSKLLLLNNSSILSPIIKLKNKGYHKYNGSMGSYTTKFNSSNTKKNIKFNNNVNNSENKEKNLKNKFNSDNSNNNSLPKKLSNKLNYLNINLNNLSNINNNIYNNNSLTTTFPTHVKTISDNSVNMKKNLKYKFLRKQNNSYNDKSLINSNNNIIILNNISMNNLNNISFDYFSKLAKKHYQSSYKTIASIKKQVYNYISKEKNLLDNMKELERNKEYYNNQKKLHKKKNNYKNKNRIKEQNLNEFNLKQINNILRKNKINESINLTTKNFNSSKKIKSDYLKTQRNHSNHNHNHNCTNSNSGNISHIKKNSHMNNFSNNFNILINTNKISNSNINKNINNNNITYTNQKTINQIIKNLKSKISKNPKEKKLKINSAQISPKKINYPSKPVSKEGKNKNINVNVKSKKTLGNSIKVKQSKKIFNKKEKDKENKKEIILTNYNSNDNNDMNIKEKCEKNVITEYNNNLKKMKKKINFNYLNDINEISIENSKKIKIKKGSKSKSKSKSKNKSKSKSKSKSKDNNISSFINNSIENEHNEIKINKKKYKNSKNSINDLSKELNDTKKKEKKEMEKEKEQKKEEEKNSLISSEVNKDKDPQQVKEYITNIIESLLIEEDYHLNKKNYINPHYLENENSELTPEMRTVAVDWLVLIHHKIFKFQENTLFLTIQIFDRYLTIQDLNTEKTELLLLASFMLASKHNEIDYVNMQETLQLSQNKFTKEQVIEMESDILDKLDFEVLAPTMMEYFKLFASFLNLSEEKINHGFYILNIVLVDFHMLEFPNFMLALAVLKLITKKINKNLIKLIRNILKENKIDKFLKMVEGEDYEDILDICSKIKILYDTFLETKYKNIQNKFAENKFNCISNNSKI